jgi:hypothetical protein
MAQKRQINVWVSLNTTTISTGGDDPNGISFTSGASMFLSRILRADLEYRLATAVKAPYLNSAYSQKSMSFFEAKLSVFPFNSSAGLKKAWGGFHVSVGPSFVTGKVGKESSWVSYVDNGTGQEVDRTSRIRVFHVNDIGYAITIGYNYNISRSLLLGIRADLSEYRNDDGYQGLGLLIGLRL